MKLHESGENYLETILILKRSAGYVRSIDIANALAFSKPSVSRAMSILKNAGHITMDASGMIELTESGSAIAEQIYKRHQMLTDFLINIGVDEDTAAADACRMEHVISSSTYEKMKIHLEKSKQS